MQMADQMSFWQLLFKADAVSSNDATKTLMTAEWKGWVVDDEAE
jgi:hypothetical protein